MKKVLTIISLFLFMFTSCIDDTFVDCDRGPDPTPPYGTPDDTYKYENGSYLSISFVYYCYNGQYIDVSYTSEDACSKWYKDSEFTSDGICDKSNEEINKIKESKIIEGYKLL